MDGSPKICICYTITIFLREGLKKTEDSVTTFHLGPPPYCDQSKVNFFLAVFFIPYNLANIETYFSPFWHVLGLD